MFWLKKQSQPQLSVDKHALKQLRDRADTAHKEMTVSGKGSVAVRQRPSLLLMKFPMRAAEATLELGLTKLKDQCEAAAQWLERLGAIRIDFGEPHFADQAEMDHLTRAQTHAAKTLKKRHSKSSTGDRASSLRLVLTAFWDIASMSAEETLMLLDRLRFEVAEDAGATEVVEEPPSWVSPEDRLRDFTSQLIQPPADEETPQFLFISRLGEEQLTKALAAAVAEAHRDAERGARAAGLQLAGLKWVHSTCANERRQEKMMERQRCAGLLAGSSHNLGEDEIVSDDLRAVEFTVSANLWYFLQ